MPALRLPENATLLLDQAQINVSDSYEDKWLLYNIAPGCSKDDTWELFQMAVRDHGGFQPEENELEELGWCWPAEPNSHELSTLQEVLDFHLCIISKRIAGEPTGQKHLAYEFGFVAITSPEWREKGVTAVHLDRDRGKWKVTRCYLPLEELGLSLTSVSDNDSSFDEVREQFRDRDENQRIGSEDTHADNKGGLVPVGAWQYSMYSTVKPMAQVKDGIPDPRGDLTFGCGEECYAAVEGQLSYEAALEQFPISYSKFVKGQAKLESSARTAVKRHPELFVVIDNENPTEGGVIIARLLWDENVDKSEDELRQVGREGPVETRRCNVDLLLETLETLANGKKS